MSTDIEDRLNDEIYATTLINGVNHELLREAESLIHTLREQLHGDHDDLYEEVNAIRSENTTLKAALANICQYIEESLQEDLFTTKLGEAHRAARAALNEPKPSDAPK
jgi:hypothetical protein